MSNPFSPRPICEFPTGTRVRIADIGGGSQARCRLCAMGLTPGTTVVVNSNGCGACRVKVRDSSVTLGRGLASKILACLATPDEVREAVPGLQDAALPVPGTGAGPARPAPDKGNPGSKPPI